MYCNQTWGSKPVNNTWNSAIGKLQNLVHLIFINDLLLNNYNDSSQLTGIKVINSLRDEYASLLKIKDFIEILFAKRSANLYCTISANLSVSNYCFITQMISTNTRNKRKM